MAEQKFGEWIPNGDALDKTQEAQASAAAKNAELLAAKDKPLSEMTDEEVIFLYPKDGFGWDVGPGANEESRTKANAIRARLEEIKTKTEK